MSIFKIPFGFKNGCLVHISQVERGLECNCFCPKCKSKLVANKGEIKSHYFSHYQKNNCSYSPETAIHEYAKQLIVESAYFKTPDLPLYNNVLNKHEIIFGEAYSTKCVIVEKGISEIVPDIQIIDGDRTLFVEIAVTSFINKIKLDKIKRINIPTIEINLSKLNRNASLDEIKDSVKGMQYKKWVYHPSPYFGSIEDINSGNVKFKSTVKNEFTTENQRIEYATYEERNRTLINSCKGFLYAGKELKSSLKKTESDIKSIYILWSEVEKLLFQCEILKIAPWNLPVNFLNRNIKSSFICSELVWKTAILAKFVGLKNNNTAFSLSHVVDWCSDRFPEHQEYASKRIAEINNFLKYLLFEKYITSEVGRHQIYKYFPTNKLKEQIKRREADYDSQVLLDRK